MKIFVKADSDKMLKAILTEKLGAYNLQFKIIGSHEIFIEEPVDPSKKKQIADKLELYGITIINNSQIELVDRIKMAIDTLLQSSELQKYNASNFLAEKLNYSYQHLSTLFTEATYSSIESYIILRKVDLAKDLLINENLTLTEIAHKLNYSSVAHLSRQFKKTTGLTPSAFQRIINQRNQHV